MPYKWKPLIWFCMAIPVKGNSVRWSGWGLSTMDKPYSHNTRPKTLADWYDANREKQAHGLTAPGITLLSTMDKSVNKPAHNTRNEIAASYRKTYTPRGNKVFTEMICN